MDDDVVSNPKHIRNFHGQLKRFNQDLDSSTRKLKGQLRTLNERWRDVKYREFEQQIDEMLKAFNRYLGQSDSYIKHLDRLATDLEKFLGRR